MDSKASEAIGIVSCPGVENTRLINGRPADARFRVWVSARLNNPVEAKQVVSRVRRMPIPKTGAFSTWICVLHNMSDPVGQTPLVPEGHWAKRH